MRHLTRDMRGWDRAWNVLAQLVDRDFVSEDGDRWQYVGPTAPQEGRPDIPIEHCFRHRQYGPEERRLYVSVPILESDWEPNATVH